MKIIASGSGIVNDSGWSMGSPGAVIIKNNDEAVLWDPMRNLSQIVFDSWHFDYFTCRLEVTTNINLPGRGPDVRSAGGGGKKGGGSTYVVPQNGASDYLLSQHNLGYIPVALGYVPSLDKALSSSIVIPNGDSFRVITLITTSSQIWLSEQYFIGQSGLPAFSAQVKVMIMDQGIDRNGPPSDAAAASFYASPNRVVLGGGKIDTERQYFVISKGVGHKMFVKPSVQMAITLNTHYRDPQRQGSKPAAATRITAYQDGAAIYNAQNECGYWAGNTGDWPHYLTSGETVGLNPK